MATRGTAGRYVCVFNRNRDSYEVALALEQAGLLDRLVTDYYAPDRPPRWLPAALARRHREGLPHAQTRSAWISFLVQTAAQVARLPMRKVFPFTDAMLGRAAGRILRRRRTHLYTYDGYMPPERLIPGGTKRVMFVYHPLPGAVHAILDDDARLYPQVAWSFAHEADSKHVGRPAPAHDFNRVDAIVCASEMTRSSLLHAGCPADRITVIPYGVVPAATPTDTTPHDADTPCRFLFVGQGVQRKGLHHLVEVWQRAAPPGATLTIVAAKQDPGIVATIASPSITLLGRQSPEELDRLYRAADVFVMPSLVEGFGLVYLEALARGCFVIGTRNTGLPALALPPEAADVIPAGDLNALAASLAAAAARQRDGLLDRSAIAAAAGHRTWADFRRDIAAHAAAVLDAPDTAA